MKIFLNIFLFAVVFVIVSNKAQAQTPELSLKDCFELSDKNEKLQITELSNLKQSDVNYKFGKLGFLPTISASPNYNISFGRKLDPFTNTFGLNTVYSNSYSLYSQITLFQGFHYFKQNKYNEAYLNNTKVDIERTKERNRNTVFEKCIAIWKLELKIEQQKKIITNTQQFKERQTELVKEGKIRAIDTLETSINFKTQTIELLKLERDRNFETMTLNYYLGFPLTQKTKLKSFTLETEKAFLNPDEFYQLQDIQNKILLNELQNKIDKTQFYPSISSYGNIGTGYSTNNKDYATSGTPIIPYDQQISNNLYQGIGFSLNIPIFNKGDYFKRQQIYTITQAEQQQLLELKKLEIEKLKTELEFQRKTLEESLLLQKSIGEDKETILKASQDLYFEGRIRLSEVEQNEINYNTFIQTIFEIQIDLFKLNAIKLD